VPIYEKWIGSFKGTSSGNIVVNIDERSSFFQGIAYLNEENSGMPNTTIVFTTQDKSKELQLRTGAILPINSATGNTDNWENVKQFYSDIERKLFKS
jgi:hypothetical protein